MGDVEEGVVGDNGMGGCGGVVVVGAGRDGWMGSVDAVGGRERAWRGVAERDRGVHGGRWVVIVVGGGAGCRGVWLARGYLEAARCF